MYGISSGALNPDINLVPEDEKQRDIMDEYKRDIFRHGPDGSFDDSEF